MCVFKGVNGNPPALNEFLRQSKEVFYKGDFHCLHLVLGNESADLDSIACSIVYAFFLKDQNQINSSSLYLPLLNIYRKELELRKDIIYLLNLLNISIQDLLFLDDEIFLEELFNAGALRLNLVDHNSLRINQIQYAPSVERIIDHHVDENIFYPLLTTKNISVVGSTATLLVEVIFSSQPAYMNGEIALLLLASILIDTDHLKSSEKTTPRDSAAVVKLYRLVEPLLPEDFYESLYTAKHHVSELSPFLLLSKDFKEYKEGKYHYGISCLPNPVCWKNKDLLTLKPSLAHYTIEKNLDFLFVFMNNIQSERSNRKILFYSPFIDLVAGWKNHVENEKRLCQILLLSDESDDREILFYDTVKVTARKILQPLFQLSRM